MNSKEEMKRISIELKKREEIIYKSI